MAQLAYKLANEQGKGYRVRRVWSFLYYKFYSTADQNHASPPDSSRFQLPLQQMMGLTATGGSRKAVERSGLNGRWAGGIENIT